MSPLAKKLIEEERAKILRVDNVSEFVNRILEEFRAQCVSYLPFRLAGLVVGRLAYIEAAAFVTPIPVAEQLKLLSTIGEKEVVELKVPFMINVSAAHST